MAYKSLRDFIALLEAEGELKRVSRPVSTHLEMTEIQTRLLKTGGPAVLFENPVHEDGRPSEMPALANLFGTVGRVARAVTLGGEPRKTASDLREVGELLAFLRQPEPPRGLKDALGMLPLAKTVMSMRPANVRKAPCQEVVLQGDDIDLDRLPIQGCWPGEPDPLITWPLVVTKGPSDDKQDDFNLGIYRMQKLGKDRAIMRWLKHRGGAQHFQRWKNEKPEPLPVACVLGAGDARKQPNGGRSRCAQGRASAASPQQKTPLPRPGHAITQLRPVVILCLVSAASAARLATNVECLPYRSDEVFLDLSGARAAAFLEGVPQR